MAKRLYVGNLSWNTNDDGLKQAMERFGEVSDARVITDRETGRSRGFGFVTFEGEDAARTAVTEMDGKDLDGRTIRVNEAHDKGAQDQQRGGGDRPSW